MKYKIGDRVKIVKISNKSVAWNHIMNKSIGMYGIITELNHNAFYTVELDDIIDGGFNYSNMWGYDEESLQSERELKLKRVLKYSI